MQVGKTSLVEEMRVENRRVIELSRPCPPSIAARDAWRARAANRVLRVVIVKPIDVRSEHQGLVRGELVIKPRIDERLSIVTFEVEMAIRRQHESRQTGREERRSILPCVVSRCEKEGFVLDDRPADRAGVLFKRIRNLHRADRPERGWQQAAQYGRRAEVGVRKRLRLPITRTDHEQSFAVQYVRAGLGDDVQCWARGPAEFGRKRVRKDRKFLHRADRHGRDRSLAAPPLIVVRAVQREGGRSA